MGVIVEHNGARRDPVRGNVVLLYFISCFSLEGHMLINRRYSLAIAVLLTAFTGSMLAAATGPRIHNLAPAFLDYWSRVESKPVAEQVQRFKTEVFPTFPEFYEFKVKATVQTLSQRAGNVD